MTSLSYLKFCDLAGRFVEMMREDFERSFSLTEFLRHARFELPEGYDEMQVEEFAFRYFREHYDLVRWSIGAQWSFISELEAP